MHTYILGAIVRTELFMHFCIKIYIRTQGEVCRQKNIFKPPVVYATDRSKAVTPVLFLFWVALWFILLFVLVFLFSPFSIVITSLGEEGAGLCASRAFVCLFCTRLFVSFFSSSWCQGLAAASDCGTPWTFLLTLLTRFPYNTIITVVCFLWSHSFRLKDVYLELQSQNA